MQRNPLSAYSPKSFTKRTWLQSRFSVSAIKNTNWVRLAGIAIGCFLLVGILAFFLYLQLRVLKNLPDVTQIKDMQLTQATIVTDRNGVELYKIFDENRQYVDLSQMSPYMIDAIVAVEDKTFWDHEGLDPIGIFRAGVYTMLGQNRGGGSTITQQLITNLMKLERPFGGSFFEKVDYKLTQIILAKRLNNVLQQQIQSEQKSLSSSEVKQEMKKKILELYLNYVFLGNNSYGVEAASKTYFQKSAKDLSIMEAAILASIPKAPGRYDPFKSTSLMGVFKVLDAKGEVVPYEGNIKATIVSKFRENVLVANFSNKKSADAFVKFVNGLAPTSVMVDGKNYTVSYTNGRAEFALGRMYEDGKVTEDQLKSAFLESLSKTFEKSAFEIKAPHFVFRIKEQVERGYGPEITKQGGLVIKTTLDSTIQQIAESAIKSNSTSLFEYGASNASMLYLDTTNGDVLAYVWSLDYFNKDIQGQNDMVKNPRQSGSSIKPLIYALGFEKLPLTIDTPIYDIPFKAGKDTPGNADGKFDGMLPLKKALGFSRNIPAVKMFFALGGEAVAKPYLQRLGLSGIKNDTEYWYPLALGAGEVSMLELANAYSHLSNPTPWVMNPILEIKASDGTILYTKTLQQQENVIKPGIISLMWNILSDPANRIGAWATRFNVRGLTYALKTGTSNVKTENGSRPRDGWLAAYTPSRAILMWAGNADARPMNSKAYGGSIHADSVKKFLTELMNNNLLTNEEMPQRDTAGINISVISGKLSAEHTPIPLTLKSLGWNGFLPKEVESPISEIEVDIQCFGKVSPLTPVDQVRKGYLIQPTTFMPNKMDIEDIKKYLQEKVQSWVITEGLSLFMTEPTQYCEGKEPQLNNEIQISFISPTNKQNFTKKGAVLYSVVAPVAIKRIILSLDGNTIASYIDNSFEIFSNRAVDLSNYTDGNHTLTLTAIDQNNATKSESIALNLIGTDTVAPVLVKEKSHVNKNEDASYVVNFFFQDDLSGIKEGRIYEKGNKNPLTTFYHQVVQFSAKSPELVLEVEDYYGNVLKEELNLDGF